MKIRHLSEADVQEHLFGASDKRKAYDEHLQACEGCRAKVEFYRQMVVDIKGQPKAEFDFDLSDLVLSKIAASQPAQTYGYLFWLFVILSLCSVVIVGFFFGNYITSLLLDVHGMAVPLILITAGLLLFFQSIEILKKHKAQMKLMDFN